MKTHLHIGNIPLQYGDAEFKIHLIQYPTHTDCETEGLPHRHLCYELHLAKTGAYDYQIGSDTIHLKKDNILIISPGSVHNAAIAGNNQYTFDSLLFSLQKATGQSGFYSYFSDVINTVIGKPFPASPCLRQLIVRLAAAVPANTIQDFCVQKADAAALITAFFACINAFSNNSKAASAGCPNPDTMLLLETLVNYPTYSLRDIARQIRYSERHTARLIQKMYHMPLSELRKSTAYKPKVEEISHDEITDRKRNPVL